MKTIRSLLYSALFLAAAANARAGSIPLSPADVWAGAFSASGERVLLADSFQENLRIHSSSDGTALHTVSYADITEVFAAANISLERGSGPSGVRDAAAHPEGGWVVLFAGFGDDVLLRVAEDFSLSVLNAGGFSAGSRGDERFLFPRLTIGNTSAGYRMAVTVYDGVAIFDLTGQLLHTLPVPGRCGGLAIEPGSSRLWMLKLDNGSLLRWDDLNDVALPAGPVLAGTVPVGSGVAQDLCWNASWRTVKPNLIAAADRNLFVVLPENGAVTRLDVPAFQNQSDSVDISGPGTLLVGMDENAWLDDLSQQPRAFSLSDFVRPPAGNEVSFMLNGLPGMTYEIQSSSDLLTWTPAGLLTLGSASAPRLQAADPALPRQFWRAAEAAK